MEKIAAKSMIITIIVSFLTAYVLAHVTFLSHYFFQNSFLSAALSTAFWLWLGFTAARFITHDVFEGRPKLLTFRAIGKNVELFAPRCGCKDTSQRAPFGARFSCLDVA
jgi:hypothetical protein